MKRIEYILDEYGFVFKIVLFVLWILWAVQLFQPARKGVFSLIEGIAELKNRDFTAERKNGLTVLEFAEKKVEQAKIAGSSYTPERYFQDLKEIEEKVELCKTIRPLLAIAELSQLSLNNIKKGHYTIEEVRQARSIYKKWYQEKTAADRESLKEITWGRVLSWLVTLYGRTIFLVLFWYLIRMTDRKGILATILAEKKKFVLATILWPVYFFKYPFNVVREIRVEAELRRLKGLFRVFNARESRLVREVANSSYYKQWLAEFHQQNKGNFQRGLFVALIATLFLYLLVPSTLRASEKRVRSPGLVFCEAKNQIEIGQNLTNDTNEDDHPVEELGLPPEIGLYEPPLLVMIVKFLKEIYHNRQPESIDRVPRSTLLGFVTINVDQTEKGVKNEYGCKDSLLGCLTNWNNRKCICC